MSPFPVSKPKDSTDVSPNREPQVGWESSWRTEYHFHEPDEFHPDGGVSVSVYPPTDGYDDNQPQPWEDSDTDDEDDYGTRSEKSNVVQEDETLTVPVVSTKEKCSYCDLEGHEVADCRYCIEMEKLEKARGEPTPPPKCEMCGGSHFTQGCLIVASYREPKQAKGENGKMFYLIDGKLCDDYEEKYMEPQVAPTLSRKQCDICYAEHLYPCPYQGSVKKGALVSPFFPILCRECHGWLDNKFWCSRCNKEMTGYVTQCYLCKVCGKRDLSPNCCPYGRLIFDNFRKSHPDGNGKLWPALEDDSC